MKRTMTTLIFATVLSLPAMAEMEHQHAQADGNQMGGMMMGAMSHEDMNAMHSHMESMQAIMSKIHAEPDPDKRKALMIEHRKEMHEAMGMMMRNGKMMHQDQQMQGMKMDDRMQMMEERMNMTGMMMWQMMEREAQEEKDGD
jgi:periplasmic protein CpxP/Spy